MQDAVGATMQIVAFSIDGVEYAFHIESVKEIIRYTEPQPTSSQVPWMRGVINLRGSIIPIIELGGKLGRATAALDPATAKILILEDGDQTIGAMVSSVDEVRTITQEQAQPAPMGAGSSYIEAVVTIDDRLVMLLDAPQLVGFNGEVEAA